MMKKIKVAILAGGPSSEHEVSLKSAENVIKNLDTTKFEILYIKITKDRIWVDQEKKRVFTELEGIEHLKANDVDIVFIVLHGEYGEDGTIQKLLESEGIKFTGSNSTASSLAMDKVASAKILTDSNLNVPSFISTNKEEWMQDNEKLIQATLDAFALPIVVKPADRGSSIGTAIVKTKKDIEIAVLNALKTSNNIMMQEFINGRELTCAVLEGRRGKVIPLIPTEIVPNSEFFDYNAKYLPGASVEITPPDLPPKIIKSIQKAAVKAHQTLGCRHISRSDFILANDVLYILEVNTIPGLTDTSLAPQGAKAMGIGFSMLIEIIIEAALK